MSPIWVFCTWQRTHCSLGELALKLSLRRLKLLIISYSTPSATGNTKVKNKVSFLWKFLYLFATKAVPGSLQREMSRQRNCSARDLVHVCTRMSMCTSVCVCVFFPLLWREPEHTLFPDLLLQHNSAFSFFFIFNRNIWARVCVCLHKRELSTVNFCFVRCLSADEKRENKRFTPLDMKMQPPHTATICISKRHYRSLPHFFHSCSVFIYGDLWDVHVGMVLNRRY